MIGANDAAPERGQTAFLRWLADTLDAKFAEGEELTMEEMEALAAAARAAAVGKPLPEPAQPARQIPVLAVYRGGRDAHPA